MDLSKLINLKLDLGNKFIELEKEQGQPAIKSFINAQLELVDGEIKKY